MNPAAHRVPIKDGTAHLDAIWRGLSYAEMIELGKKLERTPEPEPVAIAEDPDSLI